MPGCFGSPGTKNCSEWRAHPDPSRVQALAGVGVRDAAQQTSLFPRVGGVDRWNDWWKHHGDERLTLLLWAVWNPIGAVPLDEYENYTGRVVTVLHKAREADQELLGSGDDLDDTVQLERTAHAQRSTEELASLLSTLREDAIGMSPNRHADRRAAETLLDWYEWEMWALDEDAR
jgi:hypothetical protein